MRAFIVVLGLLCVEGCLYDQQRGDEDQQPTPPPDDDDDDPPPPPPPPPPEEVLDPQLTITSPIGGTVVTDHDPVTITVEVSDVYVDSFAIEIDGALSTTGITVAPTPDGHKCAPCTFQIQWAALDASEGTHVVTVHALTGAAVKTFANLELAFDDIPELLDLSPNADEDLLGVGTVNIALAVLERGTTTVTLQIDGVNAGTKTNDNCLGAEGCSFAYTWDTSTIAAGTHTLHFTIADANGNVIQDTRSVRIDDLLKVTSMNVTGIDDGGFLEMEVYIFDNATNALLGCAGSAHGLGPVNAIDTRYAVDATLVNVSGQPLRVKDLGSRSFRFEVWEDDDAPVCPTPLNPGANNLVGTSPSKTASQWKASPQPITFPGVPELAFIIGRPLTY